MAYEDSRHKGELSRGLLIEPRVFCGHRKAAMLETAAEIPLPATSKESSY